jgi:hypothetical protein
MSGVTHAVVGAALGTLINAPLPAFGVGVASHLVLDALPHNEWFPMWLEAVFSAVSIGLLVFALHSTYPAALWGALGATLPDVEIVVLQLWHGREPKREEALFHRVVYQPPADGTLSRSIQLALLLVASGYISFLLWS